MIPYRRTQKRTLNKRLNKMSDATYEPRWCMFHLCHIFFYCMLFKHLDPRPFHWLSARLSSSRTLRIGTSDCLVMDYYFAAQRISSPHPSGNQYARFLDESIPMQKVANYPFIVAFSLKSTFHLQTTEFNAAYWHQFLQLESLSEWWPALFTDCNRMHRFQYGGLASLFSVPYLSYFYLGTCTLISQGKLWSVLAEQ